MLPTVNYHLWEACNMRCKFCFATFQDVKSTILPKGHLPKEEAIELVKKLAEAGYEKITFVGGEPTLCPWLSELIATAKSYGVTTMIVTNGARLTEQFLQENRTNLDWISLSIDSLTDATNLATGRAITGNRALTETDYRNLVERIKHYGYGLKINTVVNSTNYLEDLSEFIAFAQPKRWKIFQTLPVEGQNDNEVDKFIVSSADFEAFVNYNKQKLPSVKIVPENNDAMTGSYAMVDPAGRFFDNSMGKHTYSDPILQVGIEVASKQVEQSLEKFEKREGNYDWKNVKKLKQKITISGEVASGKTTIGKRITEQLNYEFFSLGDTIREKALARNMNIVEYQGYCDEHLDETKQNDLDFCSFLSKKSHFVCDYRLGFKFIPDAFHILLKVSPEVAVDRLKSANRHNETYETIEFRNVSFRNQFKRCYDIDDFTRETNYNLVVHTERFNSSDEIVRYILDHLNF